MSALGSLVVKLALDYAEYTRGLERSDQETLDFARRVQERFDSASTAGQEYFTGIVKGAAGAVLAMVTVGAAVAAMNRSMDELAAIDDLSQKTGSAIEMVSKLQQVAIEFGHDFGAVDEALAKFATGMNGIDDKSSKIGKALSALGVSAKDSGGKLRDPGEVLVDMAKALQDYEDGAGKAALINDVFGESGAKLVPFLNDAAASVDGFTGRTEEAVEQAARFQDQTGKLRRSMGDLATDLTVAVLPAVNDLLGALIDTSKGVDDLTGKNVTGWADDLGVGLARVIDVAKLIPQILSAVGGSFKAVGADVQFVHKLLQYGNPIGEIKARMDGTTGAAEIEKALAARNKVVEESNQKLSDLWNKPANEMEQAFLKRLAERGKEEGEEPAPARRQLAYQSGGDKPEKEKKERSDYESLNKAMVDRLALLQEQISAGRVLSDAEKEIAKIQRGRAEGTVRLTDAEAAHIIAGLEVADTLQKSITAGTQVEQLYASLAKESQAKVSASISEAEANERLVKTTGRSKAEIEALALARLEEQYAQRASMGLTLDEIEELEKLIAAKKRSSAALTRVEGLEQAKKGLDELDAFLDPAKAQTFGESLKEAFGTAGDAASKLVGVLDGYGQRQAQIDKQRENAADAYKAGLIDEVEHTKRLAQLSDRETKNRLAGYGDMAGAAAGFFGEQSKGYQALMAVSKVFHAAELAMTMAELVPKGIAAVLNQGTGDPYTAFARMAAMAAIITGLGVAIGGIGGSGAGGQSAADVQKMQSTGSVLGDSEAKSESIANSMALLEENTGDLIPINRGMLSALQAIEASMTGLASLIARNGTIATGDFAMTGTTDNRGSLGQLALNSTEFFGGEGPMGDIMRSLASSILGSSKSTVIDSGITFGGSVNDLQAGQGYNQYATIETTKKKLFGAIKKKSTSTQTQGLDEDLAAQFGLIFTDLETALSAAADGLGIGAAHVTQVLDGLTIDMTKVSLKDLSGDELTEALNTVISKAMDDMAEAVFPELDAFRQVGEGYAETVVRLASDYGRLDAALTSTGDAFGAVGVGSLGARERLIELFGGIDQFEEQTASFAENYLTEAQRLAPVQKYVTEQLAAMGLASVTNRDQFAAATLSIDKTTEAGAKQYAAMMALEAAFAAVTPAMNEMAGAADLAADRTKLEGQIYDMTHTAAEALARQRAEELATMDESLRPLQERVYALQDEQVALAARSRLEGQIYDLTHTAAEALARQRAEELAAMDESLRPLQERIYTLQDEQAALADVEAATDRVKEAASTLLSEVDGAFGVLQRVVDREKTAASKAYEVQMKSIQASIDGTTSKITKLQSLSQALGSALDQMRDPNGESAATRASAQAQIRTALAIAQAGGSLPDADAIKGALSAVTQDASAQFSTYTDYLRDFYSTANDVASLGKLTDSALSVEEKTLATLERRRDDATAAHEAEMARLDGILMSAQQQIDELKGLDVSLLTISQAVTALGSAMLAAQKNPVVDASAAISKAYQGALGRAPDADGLAYWQQQAANGSSTSNIVDAISGSSEAKLRGLYTSVLGRTADAAGLDYWMDQVAAGMSLADVRKAFLASDERKSMPAFEAGGDHLGGFRLVGEGGPEIEATGPSRIFNASQTARILAGSGGDTGVLVEENKALRRELAGLRTMMESHLYAIAKNTRTSADLQEAWDAVGQPTVRTS